MTKKKKRTKILYKYRAFSSLTLNSLIYDNIFYADPTTFNDPLDTKPILVADLDTDKLVAVYRGLVEQRVRSEKLAAAASIRTDRPTTIEDIEKIISQIVNKDIESIYYSASDPSFEMNHPDRFLFTTFITYELLRRYEKGVFSMAERSDCPLMWSHYGDQHRGVCIGYSVPDREAENLHRVTYGGDRSVRASQVAAMLNNNEQASRQLDIDVLTRKAPEWRYEREWRLFGPRGLQSSPLELEEVLFGIRCEPAVKYIITKALTNRSRSVKFYDMREDSKQFKILRCDPELGQMNASLPRRMLDVYDYFDVIEDNDFNARGGSASVK